MQTKGVVSVPSQVRNLEEWSALIDHDAFIGGVGTEFASDYGVSNDPHQVRARPTCLFYGATHRH
jgi:hypothetical protein